eukprot:GEMP01044113.1.p1 GENE.GEMP01044113.1~~GEMP01044113.1.p1  ORF type:complete len:335 (+),score=72.94 GEMP01044113.1:11-1015(+)
MESTEVQVAMTTLVLVLSGTALLAVFRARKKRTDKVTIAQLIIYPIKSCRGVPVLTSKIDYRGLEGDRSYMFVREKDGTCVTAREYPALTLIAPDLPTDEGIVVRFHRIGIAANIAQKHSVVYVKRPEKSIMRDVKIFEDLTVGEDQGDEIAEIITDWLSAIHKFVPKIRLVRQTHDHKRLTDSTFVSDKFCAFADGFPMLLVSKASLEDANVRLGVNDSHLRFRPNIIVKGCNAWEEDSWTEAVGEEERLSFIKPCDRCTMPNINMETGDTHVQVAKMLRNFRLAKHVINGMPKVHLKYMQEKLATNNTFVGQNVCANSDDGLLRVGDSLSVA